MLREAAAARRQFEAPRAESLGLPSEPSYLNADGGISPSTKALMLICFANDR